MVGLLYPFLSSRGKRIKLKDAHCVITGGSKGIGFQIARYLLKEGAKVTLMSRTMADLRKAKGKLLCEYKDGEVHIEAVDVANYKQICSQMESAVTVFGPVNILVCSAGLALPGYFVDQNPSVFQHQMDVNYMGTVHAVKAVLPSMMKRQTGMLTFVTSGIVAGGFLGYSSYAPTKFAVRALADSLRSELLGFGIRVNVAYPPDTQTAGFDHENKTKPEETLLITPPEVYSAEVVGKGIVVGMKSGHYHLQGPNVIQNMAISVMAGISRRSNPLLECVFVAPLMGLIQHFWRVFHADRIAKRYASRYEQGRKNK